MKSYGVLKSKCNLVPRAFFPAFLKAREKRPGNEVGVNAVVLN